MSEINFNYSFRLGNAKIEVDMGAALSAANYERAAAKSKQIPHYHAKHELFLAKDKPLSVYSESKAEEFRDAFVFIPRFFKHYTVRSNDYRILFSIESVGSEEGGVASFFGEFFSSDSIFSFNTKRELGAYFDEIAGLLGDNSNAGRDAVESALKLIFYNIYLSFSGDRAKTPGARESYLITIERIINSYSLDSEKDVNLECVAAELHLGKKQTSRIIYKYFGKPLSDLVSEKRLALAKELLITTDLSISEIAEKSNFHSANYFYLTFKKAYGITPLSYRKEKQREKA